MESVKRSVIEILEKQGVGDPEHFEAELDSLAFVEFVIELENRFDIRGDVPCEGEFQPPGFRLHPYRKPAAGKRAAERRRLIRPRPCHRPARTEEMYSLGESIIAFLNTFEKYRGSR